MGIIYNGNCIMVSGLQRDNYLEFPSIAGNHLKDLTFFKRIWIPFQK